jgi:hypothetical protein
MAWMHRHWTRGRRCRDRMVVGFTTIYAISAYNHWCCGFESQALVSFKKYMPPPLPYFKVNICPLPLPHFASIFFTYLWSFRWPNYIVTLPRYFSFRLPHLNINTWPPSDELDKNIQRKSHFLSFSHWNGYSHFRFALDFSYAFGIL